MNDPSSPNIPIDGSVAVPKSLLGFILAFLVGGGVGSGTMLVRGPSMPPEVTSALSEINVRLTKIEVGQQGSQALAQSALANLEKRISDLEARTSR